MSMITEWLRQHVASLATTSPAGQLDDLEPLREIVGDARVVAVGEGAHFVAEFADLRARVLRFLVERCGFTALYAEYGLHAGFAADRWVRGVDDGDLADFGGELSVGVNGLLLRWLRDYNATAARPVGFAGVDLPTSSALAPVLALVVAYLEEVDPEAVAQLAPAVALAERIGGGSAVLTSGRVLEFTDAERNLLTATLNRAMARLRALAPQHVERAGQPAYDQAERYLEAACRLDYMYGVMAGVFSGTGMSGDGSVRDQYMGESVRWHLDRAEPGARVVLVAHNYHIQKTPVVHGGEFAAFPMGHVLAREFGDAYRAIALTHTGPTVPEMEVVPDLPPVGFRVVDTALAEPAAGTIEAKLVAAGLGAATTLVELRGLPATVEYIRAQSATTYAPMPAAFDAVITTPTATTDPTISF
jgi:erythromycin esterase